MGRAFPIFCNLEGLLAAALTWLAVAAACAAAAAAAAEAAAAPAGSLDVWLVGKGPAGPVGGPIGPGLWVPLWG